MILIKRVGQYVEGTQGAASGSKLETGRFWFQLSVALLVSWTRRECIRINFPRGLSSQNARAQARGTYSNCRQNFFRATASRIVARYKLKDACPFFKCTLSGTAFTSLII